MESVNGFEILHPEIWMVILNFLDPVHLHTVKFVCRKFKVWSGKPLENPLLQAIKEKNEQLIQWCIEQRFIATDQEFMELAKQGDLENIKKLEGSLQEFSTDQILICKIAAQYGHLQILQYYGSGKIWTNKGIQKEAALHGHLHILEYISEIHPGYLKPDAILRATLDGSHLHIYRWICKRFEEPDYVTNLYGLCKKGDLEFLKALGPKKISYVSMGSYVVKYPEIMEWLYENGLLHNGYYKSMAYCGNLEMILWFKSLGYELEGELEAIVSEASRGGHLHILEWIDENYKITNYPDLIIKALVNSHTHILKWTDKKYKYPYNFDHFCAIQASLEFLNWFNEKGLQFNDKSPCFAIESGDLINLEWFYTHGYALDEDAYNCAAGKGFLHIIRWLKNHKIPFNLNSIASIAASNGDVGILEWTKEMAKETNTNLTNTIMEKAIRYAHIHILKWGLLNGLSLPQNVQKLVSDKNQEIISKWMILSGFVK